MSDKNRIKILKSKYCRVDEIQCSYLHFYITPGDMFFYECTSHEDEKKKGKACELGWEAKKCKACIKDCEEQLKEIGE